MFGPMIKKNNYSLNKDQVMHLVIDFAARYGKKISKRWSNSEYRNGVTYLTTFSGDLQPYELIIHNLGHFICASPERRMLADFGLGSSPDSLRPLEPLISHKESLFEEQMASALFNIIHETLGIKNISYFNTSNPEVLKRLISYGIINKDNKLTKKLRERPDLEINQEALNHKMTVKTYGKLKIKTMIAMAAILNVEV